MNDLDPKINCHKSKLSLYAQSIFTLAIATLAFSLVPILYRISEDEISAEATIFNRFWITVLLLGVWKGSRSLFHINDQEPLESQPKLSPKTANNLVLSIGIIYFLFQLSWSQSLLSTSVANSTMLHNITPVFIMAYDFVFMRHHQFRAKRFASIIVAAIGFFMLESNAVYLAPGQIKGDLLALLSAIFNAFYLLISEKLQNHFDIAYILLSMSLIGSLMAFISLLIEHKSLFPVSFYGWTCVAAVAVLSQILGNTLLLLSLGVLPPYFVALFLLLDPVLSSVEAWIFFDEKLSIFQCLSFFVILISIVIAAISYSTDQAEMNLE